MAVKTPVIIIVSIALLTVAMLLLLEPPGYRSPATESGTTGRKTGLDGTNTGRTIGDPDSLIPPDIQGQIDQASSNEDFAGLVRLLLGMASTPSKEASLEAVYDQWVKLDVSSALSSAKSNSDGNGKLLEHALVTAGMVNFPDTYHWIEGQSYQEAQHSAFIAMLFYGVSRKSPAFALTFIDLLPEGEQKDRIMTALVEQWADRDLQSALDWMNLQQLSEPMEKLKESLSARSPAEDVESPGDVIRDMEVGEEKNNRAREYADKLARSDIQAAMSWARSLNDPESYKVALSAVFEDWIAQEEDKRKVFEELLIESDDEVRDYLVNEITVDIASHNPAQMAELLDYVPDSEKVDVADKVVRFWQEQSPDEVYQWVLGLNPGPACDRAASILVDRYVYRDKVDEALQLAAKISDTQQRYESTQKLIAGLSRVNPAKTRKTVEEVDFLTDAQKQSILDSVLKESD